MGPKGRRTTAESADVHRAEPYLDPEEVFLPETHRSHWLPLLQALFVTILWSSSWVLIKHGLEEIPAISFAGLRYTLAFLVLLPFLLARLEHRVALKALRRADWLRLALLGVVLYAFTQGAQFVGLAHLPAAMLSLVLSFSPAAVAMLGAAFLEERLAPLQWSGVAIFLGGALLYFLPLSVSLSSVGLMVAVGGMLSNAGGAILGRSVNRLGHFHPLLVTVVSMGVGAFLLLGTGLAVEGVPELDASGWTIVLWLAVVNTALAFTLWNHTLRRLTAIESSLVNNTMLIQIAILAWWFLDEPISVKEAIGLLVALVGMLLVQLPAIRSGMKRSTKRPSRAGA